MNVDEVYDLYKPSGVITMKIDKFSEFVNGGEHARRLSDPIYIQGLPWKILAIPRESGWRSLIGNRTFTYETLGYFLQCNAENQATNWSCHASAVLKVLAHKEGNEHHCRKIEHTFNAKENDWGFEQFLTFEGLIDPEYSWYDEATDSITLSVEINADIPVGIEMEIPSQTPQNMGNLFDKRDQFSDCVLISSDKIEFKAYKGILACSSPVFAGMFQHGMVEAQDGIVRIPDIRSEVLEPMLHFMYNGTKPNLEGKENIVGELLVAADKYELMPLKVFCEHKLATSLNIENACELVALADLHSAKLLKNNALKFIKENSNEVIQTEGWKMLMKGNYMELYSEIVKAIIEYAK